jgi:hypothetical protein
VRTGGRAALQQRRGHLQRAQALRAQAGQLAREQRGVRGRVQARNVAQLLLTKGDHGLPHSISTH